MRLAAARQYDVPALLPHALDDVLNRDRPVSLVEAEVLGFELALNIMTYREEWMRRSPGGRCVFSNFDRLCESRVENELT